MIFLVSCSYAGALFADACLKGLNGVPDVVECSYVQSSVTELPFFASKVISIEIPVVLQKKFNSSIPQSLYWVPVASIFGEVMPIFYRLFILYDLVSRNRV